MGWVIVQFTSLESDKLYSMFDNSRDTVYGLGNRTIYIPRVKQFRW